MMRSNAARLDKLLEKVNSMKAINYDKYRDENNDLILEFQDKSKITLPPIPFRPHQEELQRQLYQVGKRYLYVWRPRRSGKEVESWNLLIQSAITDPGLYLMIYPTNVRARMVLWDGSIIKDDGTTLKFIDMIPRKLVKGRPNDHDMVIKLKNGSVIKVLGSDVDPDKLRGINVRGAVLSEFAFSDPRVMHILMPIFRLNKGWLLLQTTPNGMNHAYRLMKDLSQNPAWYTKIDTADTIVDKDGNRYITDEMIEEDRRSAMPEWMIQQEYYCNVTMNQDLLYFSLQVENIFEQNKLIPQLILPKKRVYTAYDIGVNDATAVTMFQLDHNFDPVIINYFENNNKELKYYVDEAHKFCNKHGLSLFAHYVPHDAKKRSFGDQLKTVIDYGREMGERFIAVDRPKDKIIAINQMRRMLYRTKFNKENTVRLIDCLSNYTKEYDEKNSVYKNNPKHDWTCHGVDSYQTMTLALENGLINVTPSTVMYYN